MGKPAEVLAGTNYSCSLLAHTPEPKCLRLGSQEADLKTKINVQVVYLKKCSQRRLIGDWGNKAGQERSPRQEEDSGKPLQRVLQPDSTGESKFHLRNMPKDIWVGTDIVIYDRPETEISPSSKLRKKNHPGRYFH